MKRDADGFNTKADRVGESLTVCLAFSVSVEIFYKEFPKHHRQAFPDSLDPGGS